MISKKILSVLPVEFHSILSYAAKGNLIVLQELAERLKNPIKEFQERLQNEKQKQKDYENPDSVD